MRFRPTLPSPSMAVAMTALFVALSGTGYAATQLHSGRGDVQAVATKKKTKPANDNAQDLAFLNAHKDLLTGPRGPAGVAGSQGLQGIQGVQGVQGIPGPVTGTLPSGVTLKGTFDVNSPVSSPGLHATQEISFGLQLATAPTVHYIASGAAVPAGCSGSVTIPGAASGNFCIFEAASFNGTAVEINPVDQNANEASTFGGAVQVTNAVAGAFNTFGTWAVTG